MSDWELKPEEQEFEIPSEPVNPMTPERLRLLRVQAEDKMLALYKAMTQPSGSFDTRIKTSGSEEKS
jgi:hypothetical protein